MCIKTDNRIECIQCSYPLSEALYPDNTDEYDEGFPHTVTQVDIDAFIRHVQHLQASLHTHYYDCKCLLCR